jgi:hypothetical protein
VFRRRTECQVEGSACASTGADRLHLRRPQRRLGSVRSSARGAFAAQECPDFCLEDSFPAIFALSKALLPVYNGCMANGGEIKSLEMQQIDQQEQIRSQEIVDEKERVDRLKAEEARKVQALKLTRARVREQLTRTSSERYTLLLNSELKQIDGELAKLI